MVIRDKTYINKTVYYLAGTDNSAHSHLHNQYSVIRHNEMESIEIYKRFGKAVLKSLRSD